VTFHGTVQWSIRKNDFEVMEVGDSEYCGTCEDGCGTDWVHFNQWELFTDEDT